MSDKFKVANAPEKDISEMDFKELRNKVQSLNDAFELAMRKLYDTTENLDESNFSSGFLLKQNKMKAQLTATAEAVELKVSAEDLEGKLSNYSTVSQTAWEIQHAVTAVETNTTSLISTAIGGIKMSVSNGEKSSTITLRTSDTQIYSEEITLAGEVVFKSDLKTEGATVINGSNIKTGTISADFIGANELYGGIGAVALKHPLVLAGTVGGSHSIAGLELLSFGDEYTSIRSYTYDTSQALLFDALGGYKFQACHPCVRIRGVDYELISAYNIGDYSVKAVFG